MSDEREDSNDLILEIKQMFPQLQWQREKKSIGMCVGCGRRKIHYLSKSRCEYCLVRNAAAGRRYRQSAGMVKGVKKHGGGKPPLLSNDLRQKIEEELNESNESTTPSDSEVL